MSRLLVVVAGFAAVVAVVSMATGSRFLVVEGGSMRPALQPGDLIVVRPYGRGSLRRGDVVSYEPHPGAATVTHRVVGVPARDEGVKLETKGDANGRPDLTAVGSSSIQGKVVAVVPKVGIGARLLRTPAGFLAGIVLPALLLVVGEARRIRRQMAGFAR